MWAEPPGVLAVWAVSAAASFSFSPKRLRSSGRLFPTAKPGPLEARVEIPFRTQRLVVCFPLEMAVRAAVDPVEAEGPAVRF